MMNMANRICILSFLAVVLICNLHSLANAQGMLSKVSQSVREKKTKKPKKKTATSNNNSSGTNKKSNFSASSVLSSISAATRRKDVPSKPHASSHHRPTSATCAGPTSSAYFGFHARPPVVEQNVYVYEAPNSYVAPNTVYQTSYVPQGDNAYQQLASPMPPDMHTYESLPDVVSGSVAYSDNEPPINIAAESASQQIEFADNWFQEWNMRMSANYGSDFDDLTLAGMDLLIAEPGSLGLDTSVNYLLEEGSNFRNHLWIGDVNLIYETLLAEHLRGRIGVGMNWLGDSIGGKVGLNLTAGLDLQINQNWILSGQADIGSLGDADFRHGQINLGRRFGAAELLLGYDHYDIYGIDLGNWYTGLRLRY
jgi:hypothetical protein